MAPLTESERMRLEALESRNRELELAQRRSASDHEHQLAGMVASMSSTLDVQERNREAKRIEREQRERENDIKRVKERDEMKARVAKIEHAVLALSGPVSNPALRLLLQFLAIFLAAYLNAKK